MAIHIPDYGLPSSYFYGPGIAVPVWDISGLSLCPCNIPTAEKDYWKWAISHGYTPITQYYPTWIFVENKQPYSGCFYVKSTTDTTAHQPFNLVRVARGTELKLEPVWFGLQRESNQIRGKSIPRSGFNSHLKQAFIKAHRLIDIKADGVTPISLPKARKKAKPLNES